jgi:Tfp pilus assembly protein PilX
MATEAIEGVVAAGRVPTWIVQPAQIPDDPTEGSWEILLGALTHANTVKADCHMDAGDVSVTRTPTTKSRQRMCQVVAETVKTGETIDITLSAVFDQQEAMSADVNEVYSALPEGATVYIVQAFGWDSSVTPTVATVVDVFKATVQSRMKTQPTTFDEDIKFQAVLSGSAYFADVDVVAA